LVFGDEWMGLYKDKELMVEGVTLSFGDILEACYIPCELASVNLDWFESRVREIGKPSLPQLLDEVQFDGDDLLPAGFTSAMGEGEEE
jgi:hypothetical protein